MGLQRLSHTDIVRQLNRAGISGSVQASQVLEAFRLYLQSEFPDTTEQECQPLFIRHHALIVRATSSELMQALRDREGDVLRYLTQATGVKVEKLQFRF